jgi:hypothetical protein
MDHYLAFIVHYESFKDVNFKVLKFMDGYFVPISTLWSTLHMMITFFGVWTPTTFERHSIYKHKWGWRKYGLLFFLIRFWFFNLFFMMCSNNREFIFVNFFLALLELDFITIFQTLQLLPIPMLTWQLHPFTCCRC